MGISRLMGILLLIIFAIAIGNKVIYKSDFAVLTGTMTISASSSESKVLPYPTGLNKNNCVLISNGIVLNNDSNEKGYNYYGMYTDSTDGLNNAFRRRINLIDSGIKLYIQNPNTDNLTLQYKLVLMKIA